MLSFAPVLPNSVPPLENIASSFFRSNGGGEANVNGAAGDVVDCPNAKDGGGEVGTDSLGGEGTVDDGGRDNKSGVEVPSFDSVGESSFTTRRLISTSALREFSAATFPKSAENLNSSGAVHSCPRVFANKSA